MRQYYQDQQADYARFLGDTKNHRLTIHQNDGLYRHMTMRNPQSGAYHFNVTTFPGYLVFTGDMGSYTFSRLRDMFEFHRIDWDREVPTIDYGYWGSKAEALDRHGGETDFDENAFKQAALRAFWDHDWTDIQTKRQVWEYDVRDIISGGHNNGQEATRAMMGVSYDRTSEYDWGGSRTTTCFPFDDFYEYGQFKKPGFRLKWACWAIAYTIRCFDKGGDRFARQAAHDKLVLSGEW